MLFRCSTTQNDPRRRQREGNDSKKKQVYLFGLTTKQVFLKLISATSDRFRGRSNSSQNDIIIKVPISLLFSTFENERPCQFDFLNKSLVSTSSRCNALNLSGNYRWEILQHDIRLRSNELRDVNERKKKRNQWHSYLRFSNCFEEERAKRCNTTDSPKAEAHAKWEIPFV